MDKTEDILNDLAKKGSDTNARTRLRQSLSRFCNNSEKDYYFDEIKVFSPYEFKNFVTQNI